ncbi:MAG TPA: hypothetical protein VLL98_05650 [Rickettsiales bacterium]|nr:hypothetical protein [Rickettsiales bacterium]
MVKILNLLILLSLFVFEIGYAKQQEMLNKKTRDGQPPENMDAQIFKEMDTDNNNCISYEEFKAFSKKRMGNNMPPPPQNNMQQPDMDSEMNEKME